MNSISDNGWKDDSAKSAEIVPDLNEERDVQAAIAAALENEQGTSKSKHGIDWWSDAAVESRVSTFPQNKADGAAPEIIPTSQFWMQKSLETNQTHGMDKRSPIGPKKLELDPGLELPIAYDWRGDTHIYIDPPAKQPEQDSISYQRYHERCKAPLLLRKETLLRLNSPFFEKFFKPTYQHRILRRRGLVGKLPENIKYVIDLTPPDEGEEAAYLMTELSCVEGVRLWYQSNQVFQVSNTLVGGREDYAIQPSTETSKLVVQKSDSVINDANMNSSRKSPNRSTPDPQPLPSAPSTIPMEYSPIRHRSAIERVLIAIQGGDPYLDSAPKVWTTFAVAKYYGIVDSPLTDYIVRWLRAFPNSYFLEVLPEIGFQIADGLQCHDVCRDAFAILVGEAALEARYRSRFPSFSKANGIHGRKRYELPETLQTRVEYASKVFMDRITAEFLALVDDHMEWVDSLAEFKKLSLIVPLTEREQCDITRFKRLLRAYVRGAIFKFLYINYAAYSKTKDFNPSSGQDLFLAISPIEVWNDLAPLERVLSSVFWKSLQSSAFLEGNTNFHVGEGWGDFWPSEYTGLGEPEQRLEHKFEQVQRYQLEQAALFVDSFSVDEFLTQAKEYLATFSVQILYPPDALMRTSSLDLKYTGTLACLQEAEWKFLPLWAGGNDDGSGGVFNDDIPISNDGFSTAGPKVHTKFPPSISDNSSDITIIGSKSLSTGIHTSLVNNDGHSDMPSLGVVVLGEELDHEWGQIPMRIETEQIINQEQGSTSTGGPGSSTTLEFDDDCMIQSRPDERLEEDEKQLTREMTEYMRALEIEEIAEAEQEIAARTESEDVLDDVFMMTDEDNDAFEDDDEGNVIDCDSDNSDDDLIVV